MTAVAGTTLADYERACATLGLSPDGVLEELIGELVARAFLTCIPDSLVRSEQVTNYAYLVLGEEPTDELLERVEAAQRGSGPRRRFDASTRRTLEARQNFGCATCGQRLIRDSRPHLDHILPLALGGADAESNLQLLCRDCNLGKSMLLGWHLDIPYYEKRLTSRLRYCVLARFGGRCQVSTCSVHSPREHVNVVRRIPRAAGGNYAFDNLTVLCDQHKGNWDTHWRSAALRRPIVQRGEKRAGGITGGPPA